MFPTRLKGARTHNLKGIDLELRPGEVVVFAGVSGAGKSSLALDTLYAEGQRRFVESFSPYARQFLERLERPPMESLDPIAAGVAVDRRAPVKSSRSTVATMADLEPYLAALFAREALPACPEHGVDAEWLDAPAAAERALASRRNERVLVGYPLPVHDTESYLQLREELSRDGLRRLLVDGQVGDIDTLAPSVVLAARQDPQVIVDRVKVGVSESDRLIADLELAWARGNGAACLTSADGASGNEAIAKAPLFLRKGLGCPECGRGLDPPTARLFSYESPLGACAECRGFGRTIGIDFDKVIPDPSRTLKQGAIRPWRQGKSSTWERRQLRELCARHDIPFEVPWQKLTAEQQRLVLDGDGAWAGGKFPGVRGWFRWLETKAYKMHVRVMLARYRSYDRCAKCDGARLNEVARSYHVGKLNLAEWHGLEIHRARGHLEALATRTKQGELARTELCTRLEYLERVGLGYLTLERQARTLSGGEGQRVTLTAALGTSLHNALFVLDEPTVGLHASDVERLCGMFRELADRGNCVVIVEHDPVVLKNADRIVELGPGSGAAGGFIVADGPPAALLASDTATARALRPAPPRKRAAAAGPRKSRGALSVRGACANNLNDVDAEIPLGVVTAVTGPSGSGKSTLAVGIVYRALARHLGSFDNPLPGEHESITGLGAVKSVELVDQSPLGRTSRGNAATYTGAWNRIRTLFAAEPAAEARDFGPAHFSFNVDGGRCEACAGEGAETVEMQFLADVRLSCPVCRGRRFRDVILEVKHRGLDISEVLALSVDEVLERFASETDIVRKLGPLQRLGLGYLRIGQPLSTLSGGEAQRLKLARALSRVEPGALFILDEPSAGLHADEVVHLLSCLDAIVLAGGTVLVVEHDLDVIRAADWVIDLGPRAGADGGRVVAVGTPAEVSKSNTLTGRALRKRARPASRTVKARPCAPALRVERAREHNLREVSVTIPHGALTVVTGPSGSGKSTLAFDVIFAEGQRRFLETLTPYARQFLPTMPRADVDHVSGVPPSIALEQRTARAGAHSTVATVTEIAHYLRLLFAKLGTPHCPDHDEPIAATTAAALLTRLRKRRGKFTLLAPAIQARKGTYLDIFTSAAREGITEALCDGDVVSTDDPPRLARHREHTIDLVIARDVRPVDVDEALLARVLAWGHGSLRVQKTVARAASAGAAELLSVRSACPVCAFSVPELDPRWFSFNTKQGRCETCEGEGWLSPDKAPRRRRRRRRKKTASKKAETKKAARTPRSAVAAPPPTRTLCPDCAGTRLAPVPRAVRLHDDGYHDVVSLSVGGALAKARRWRFDGDEKRVASPILKELNRRLEFLCDVGLDYLHLDRAAKSLSGGEMQRLRLAAQLGAGLTGALYVLDEPTIGLHPSDTERLLRNLRALVDIGSTVVVVEHDLDTIRAADYLLDLGPSGGAGGGQLLASGTPAEVLCSRRSTTARALREPPQLRTRRPITREHERLTLEGATLHNLRDVTLGIPLNRFTVVAGVSGSGKSTLVRQVLLPALRQRLGLVSDEPGAHRDLRGIGSLKRAIAVDQSPIGRTPRSVPATFLGIWDDLRALFAATPEARMRGFTPARFSFNTPKGGRCALCEGQGVITHEMSFLPDVVTPCAGCGGQRFETATLGVRYLGLTIGEVLDLTAEQGAEVFANHRRIARPLQTLTDLGAGYIHLGQGSHTLSGGEAQRLKLAAELTATVRHEPTLYVLDEPTTGLHIRDVSRLMSVLDRLVERGDTLAVIEHHPEVIAGADWIVELGPGGGDRGGKIVAEGVPERLAKRKTPTAEVVRRVLASSEC